MANIEIKDKKIPGGIRQKNYFSGTIRVWRIFIDLFMFAVLNFMFGVLLILHSGIRWLVLITLLLMLFRSYRGWARQLDFNRSDNVLRLLTVSCAHLQLLIGLVLYVLSPLVRYFYNYFPESVHITEIRFFGMEHITMMLLAMTCISIGSIRAKRKIIGYHKFRTIALWYSLALFMIFTSIPWEFSPFTSRPYFRWF